MLHIFGGKRLATSRQCRSQDQTVVIGVFVLLRQGQRLCDGIRHNRQHGAQASRTSATACATTSKDRRNLRPNVLASSLRTCVLTMELFCSMSASAAARFSGSSPE